MRKLDAGVSPCRRRGNGVDVVNVSTAAVVVVMVLQLSWVQVVVCQVVDGSTDPTDPTAFPVNNPEFVKYFTGVAYDRMSNVTENLVQTNLAKNSFFCIDNPQMEWEKAFNFSSNLTFVSNCIIRTKGDITQRVCTAKEVNLYFSSFSLSGSAGSIRANKNCNMTSWVKGCEPGWGCTTNSNLQVNLTNSLEAPERTQDCQPCCEGFFCPRGITCMIPCPSGSYCPLAKLNEHTGTCEPYNYQLPPGLPNHTCGGANIWSDVGSSGALFCSAGSYCPTSIQQSPCRKGNYCPRGSTAEERCFKLTSCNPSTANQNMHVYGVMLIAGLSTILLIFYNCSDQFITIRERHRAQTREAAARSVREKVLARARWKSAKAAVQKQATELQAQVSQPLSLRRNENVKASTETELRPEDNAHPSVQPTDSNELEQSSIPSIASTNPLMRMMKDIEDRPDNFIILTENQDAKNQKEENREINTRSQIFKYAYAELEKEKAQQQQNKNLTFSGVVAMATNTKIRRRSVIEIAFRGLTVTLKGKNKHLLRSVTGRMRPGRITAVMGPSGAGKTTFLCALAGKTIGCRISGSIFINGKTEPIQSHRKIVGFVPQDDIVHGNLTVEENLWFSARCRLSSDLPKPDKVLIVERVIESLGLQTVRSSLVGTVEKRGISGGQRKRVNVGLELVMEPSVLFLDEPTSGLDSSSSQLLLRALRREALEGVNICMVVHQPSYTLFKTFHELILLAKGGLTVYHGSVSKVEEYFSGLGIDVPERVNPPDYYIDVLEGLVKPTTRSNFHYEELPVQWMLHNGYPVPPDMQKYAASLTTLPTEVNDDDQYLRFEDYGEQSFAGEMWQDVKCDIERWRDVLRRNFLRTKDLSDRRTPSVLMQYKFFLGRLGKQRLREARMQAVDLLILLVAGACLGSLSKSSDTQFGAPGYTHTIIAVSLLCKIAALRSFSLDKLQFWRESASGISSLAHFVAKDTMDHFNTVIKPVVYLSMFYFFNNPRSSFTDNYIVLLCLVYCVTGIAYALAIFLAPGPSQLLSVLLPVVLTLIATQTGNDKVPMIVADFCYPKWALEAFVIANVERYHGVWLITRCAALLKNGYDVHDWYLCMGILVLTGVSCRVIAFLGLLASQRR